MTQSQHVQRYRNLAQGHELVESRLHRTLPEFVNAEVAMCGINNMQQAQQWLHSTFLWHRCQQNHGAYGLSPIVQHGSAGIPQAAAQKYLQEPLALLERHGLVQLEQHSGKITTTVPGTYASWPSRAVLMAKAFMHAEH